MTFEERKTMNQNTRVKLRSAILSVAPSDLDQKAAWAVSDAIVEELEFGEYRNLSIGHRAILGTAVERLNESDQLVLQAEIP
jgi:hypothetical protein